MSLGIIVKAWSDWYDCQTEEGRLSCQLRGRVKRVGEVLVGDRVRVTPRGDGEGVIEEVQPRRNQLERPPVANVDVVAVVACWQTPPWSPELVDRILVQAAARGCDALLVINKIDLVAGCDLAAVDQDVLPYRAAGYPVLFTSAVASLGLDRLAREVEGHVLCLAGPSGAGKSRLLAALAPGHAVRSGELSERLGHGRHTTRHAELLPVGDGWVVDTPGFSRLDVDDIAPARMGGCFPEIAALSASCRFRSCLHRSEPGCAVRGVIDAGRHARYLRLLAECERRPQPVAARSRRPQAGDEDLEEDEDLGEDEGDWDE